MKKNQKLFKDLTLYIFISSISFYCFNFLLKNPGTKKLIEHNLFIPYYIQFYIFLGLFLIFWLSRKLSKKNFIIFILLGCLGAYFSSIISYLITTGVFYRNGVESLLNTFDNFNAILALFSFIPFFLLGWLHGIFITGLFYWTKKFWLKP